jgi:hypothetical protein
MARTQTDWMREYKKVKKAEGNLDLLVTAVSYGGHRVPADTGRFIKAHDPVFYDALLARGLVCIEGIAVRKTKKIAAIPVAVTI